MKNEQIFFLHGKHFGIVNDPISGWYMGKAIRKFDTSWWLNGYKIQYEVPLNLGSFDTS